MSVRADPRPLLRAVAVLAWAILLDWMWLSGEAANYAAPRTTWVVAFGAIALSLSGLVLLATVPTRTPGPLPDRRELLAAVALCAPVLAVAVVPAPTLGALAVSKKGSTIAERATASQAEARRGEPLNLYDLAAAASPEYASARGIKPGSPVLIQGLVSDVVDDREFVLSRFRANCCAADALAYSATVRMSDHLRLPAATLDQWLEVRGRLVRRGRSWAVQATGVKPIGQPRNPYL